MLLQYDVITHPFSLNYATINGFENSDGMRGINLYLLHLEIDYARAPFSGHNNLENNWEFIPFTSLISSGKDEFFLSILQVWLPGMSLVCSTVAIRRCREIHLSSPLRRGIMFTVGRPFCRRALMIIIIIK